jgi:hypothetical protein
VSEFLADDPAQCRFQRLATATHEIPKGLINETLVIASAALIHLVSKPLEDILIQPNSDSHFAGWNRQYGSALAFSEIVFLPHEFS